MEPPVSPEAPTSRTFMRDMVFERGEVDLSRRDDVQDNQVGEDVG